MLFLVYIVKVVFFFIIEDISINCCHLFFSRRNNLCCLVRGSHNMRDIRCAHLWMGVGGYAFNAIPHQINVLILVGDSYPPLSPSPKIATDHGVVS